MSHLIGTKYTLYSHHCFSSKYLFDIKLICYANKIYKFIKKYDLFCYQL